MSPGIVALLVATIAAFGGIIAKRYESQAVTKASVQTAVTATLDQVWSQRVLFRDEQIVELRRELAEQDAETTKQITALSDEIKRLTALVVELGGVPHER